MCTFSQVVVVVGLFSLACGVEIVEHSSDVLVEQGGGVELSCTGDSSWSMCAWDWDTTTSSRCDVASSAKGDETICSSNDRMAVTGTEDSCTVRVDVMELDDGGHFTCKLVQLGDGTDVSVDSKQINVEIAVPAAVAFAGDISQVETEKWMVEEGETYKVECDGMAGYPAADIAVYLGEEEDITEDDAGLDVEDAEPVENEDDARLLDVHGVFLLTPERGDCGKFVKCEGKQVNEEGELLFGSSIVRHKQIMVVFPPRDLDSGDVFEFGYSEEHGSGEMEVVIQFESHPAPTNEQVQWHLGEAVLSPGEVFNVEMEHEHNEEEEHEHNEEEEHEHNEGEEHEHNEEEEHEHNEEEAEEDGENTDTKSMLKYEAKEVEKDEDSDTVTVRLIIHNVEQQDADVDNFIEVSNGVGGDQVLRIPFNILFEAAPLIETTTEEVLTTEIEEEHTSQEIEEEETSQDMEQQDIKEPSVEDQEPQVKSEGAGGGTVAAIILILVALAITAGVVLFLKKKERLCFKPYQEVNQKPDPEAQSHKTIIKDQQKKEENGQNDEKL